jgi:nickel/cobalt exporter
MPDLTEIIQSSAAHAWLYLPFAALLGALHALEPGHAKSLMAAYIVAIRGTTAQAVTLAFAAATGHTIVVWGIAVLGSRWANGISSSRPSLG